VLPVCPDKKEARTEARASFAAPTAALIANRDGGFARAGESLPVTLLDVLLRA
jgi:hypothetical protein